MKILALDPATTTGWAISKEIYGTWNIEPKRDESVGMRLIHFKCKIREVVEAEKIEFIAFERPSGIHRGAIIVHSELMGVIKTFCEENKIEYKGYSANEIKKFATDNGNAKKKFMIEAAKKKLGYKGKDDNEADALWLLHLAKKELGIK